MTPCPDEATILAFGRGEGEPSLRRSVEYHVKECDECRSLVSVVVRSSSILPRAKVVDVMAPTTPLQGGGASEPPAEPVAPVAPGDTLADKYVVERVLGAGGMGVVVAARHLQLGQRFAIKFLLPAACEMPDAVTRFLREGKAAAQITSEHVARVVDTGTLENGSPYLVMEYLEGSDLGSLAEPLSPEDAVEYVLQACEAIVEAHELGIVHRDLKPANMFLSRRKDGSPLVKVLDFGISKASSGSSPQLTSTSMMMGSPRYMSPEQMISAKDVDARTDVWALGVILFELVSGKPVWEADTVQGLCAMIATAKTPSLRKHVPDAPDLLDDIIARCLAKEPDQRVPSVADLALLLTPLANPAAQTSIDRILRVAGLSRALPIPRPPAALGGVTHGPAIVSQPPTSIRASAPAGSRVVTGLGIVIALVAAAAGGMFFLKKERPPAINPTAEAAFPPPPVRSETPPPPAASSAVPAVALSAMPATSASAKPKLRHKPTGAPAEKIDKLPALAPGPAPTPGPDPAMSERK